MNTSSMLANKCRSFSTWAEYTRSENSNCNYNKWKLFYLLPNVPHFLTCISELIKNLCAQKWMFPHVVEIREEYFATKVKLFHSSETKWKFLVRDKFNLTLKGLKWNLFKRSFIFIKKIRVLYLFLKKNIARGIEFQVYELYTI